MKRAVASKRAPEASRAAMPATRPSESTHSPSTGHAEADLDAGRLRGLDQERVEHGAARSVERLDAGLGLDLDDVDGVAVAHHVPVHGGRAGRDHAIEQAPAAELEDAGPHQRMGRERVALGTAAIDQEHAAAAPREQHGGGGAGDAGADDDGVVLGACGTDLGWRVSSEVRSRRVMARAPSPLS